MSASHMTPARPVFTVRTVQLLRALFAAIAALMITFSSDHSASVGLTVFGGFAVSTALVCVLAAWLVTPRGARWPYLSLAAIAFVTGTVAGVPALHSPTMFFLIMIIWGAVSGLLETWVGVRERRARAQGADATPLPDIDTSRDWLMSGGLAIVLALAVVAVPAQYSLNYSIEGAGNFTLTGITIAVGIFGGYVAILAVLLGIAGLTPRPASAAPDESDSAITEAPASRATAPDNGGIA